MQRHSRLIDGGRPRGSRRPPPPWAREQALPLHPIGPARRRFPRAYDGPELLDVVPRRYRRAYDGGEGTPERRHVHPRRAMSTLRQSPLRNGLIGLAVAGTAAPIAVNRYQQALRNDPTHETFASHSLISGGQTGDDALTKVWQNLESGEAAASTARDAAILKSISDYADFGLERALAEEIYDTAIENEINPDVAFGLVKAESSFKNTSTSPVGAVGLTQLMPKTAAWLQPGVTKSELRDPETNLRIGFKYLKQLIDKYEGDETLALLAYNRGPGTVDRELRKGNNPDNGYAAVVKGIKGMKHTLYTNH